MRSKHTVLARMHQGHEHANCAEGKAPCLGARAASGHCLTSGTAPELPAREQVKQHTRSASIQLLRWRTPTRSAADVGKRGIVFRFAPDAARSITSIYRSETSRLGARAGHERHVPISIRTSPPRRCRTPCFPCRLVVPAVGSFLPFLPTRESLEVSSDPINVTMRGHGVFF